MSQRRRTIPNVLNLSDCPDKLKQKIIQESKIIKNKFNRSYSVCGRFIRLAGFIYIYSHGSNYSTCSSLCYSDIEDVFNVTRSEENLCKCSQPGHHYCLEPFFYDDGSVLQIYMGLLSAVEDKSKIEAEIGKIKQKMSPHKNPICNWDENDWTVRLVDGIDTMFPDMNVVYSAEMGLNFSKSLIKKTLHLPIYCASFYLFRGAPDIIIEKKIVIVNSAGPDSTLDCDSSDEMAVENTNQRPPLKTGEGRLEPEILGELLAGLYILLVSKVLRRIVKEENIDKRYEVKGLLIDKVCGVVRCSLCMNIQGGFGKFYYYITDCNRGVLTSDILCNHLQKLM